MLSDALRGMRVAMALRMDLDVLMRRMHPCSSTIRGTRAGNGESATKFRLARSCGNVFWCALNASGRSAGEMSPARSSNPFLIAGKTRSSSRVMVCPGGSPGSVY
jgi:hypothetical protein